MMVKQSLLTVPLGDEIGSTMIDFAFQELARQRLARVGQGLGHDRSTDDVAWDMTKKHFAPYKLEFGTADSDRQKIKFIEVPGMPLGFSFQQARISRGRLEFTKSVLQILSLSMYQSLGLINFMPNVHFRFTPLKLVLLCVLTNMD